MLNDKKITRLRTIKQCLTEIKNADSDTAITEWYIRRLCKEKKIICYYNGNKIFVNYDSLWDYLNFYENKKNI